MITLGPNVKRCPKGHPVDSDVCFYCRQEERDWNERLDKILGQIKGLVERGDLRKDILGHQ